MTSAHDPPRLRTLKSELPSELLLALQDSPDERATPAELAALARAVKSGLSNTASDVRRARKWPRAPFARGRVAAVAFTFALGAAAGVAGSSAVFFVLSSNSGKPPIAAAPSKKNLPRPPTARAPEVGVAAPLSAEDVPAQPHPVTRESARVPARNPTAELSSTAPSRPAPGTRDEFALLARAQAALAKNPGSALALASDHERNFPNGALVQERELVTIDALLRLGRRAEAVTRAARFHQQFPSSVHGRRIDVLLGSSEAAGDARH